MNNDLFTLHRNTDELQEGLSQILKSPKDAGTLKLIVARPKINQRQSLDMGRLDIEQGLIGDNWKTRDNYLGKAPNLDMQLNIMNSRCIALLAENKDDWPMAGDQLFVDMDLSASNLPAGTQLSLGKAVIEVTAESHLGCAKFSKRFGKAATAFVNSRVGKANNLRGICAKVVESGDIQLRDLLTKLD